MAASSPRGYALRLLKQRLRSVWEIDQALLRRQVPEEERQEIITSLTEAGLLDDVRLARAWVNDRDRFQPRGAIVLRQELMKKGIAKEIIDQTLRHRLEREEEPIDEYGQALQVAEPKMRLYARLDPETRRRRLGGFLLRRGFSLGTVRRILDA
ncbi:MAG TPA: regulatory protein RecX [Verrucomicrobiae bacterium]|nr:regulatory protein RecX [Verrucomicrobiae bacterium]